MKLNYYPETDSLYININGSGIHVYKQENVSVQRRDKINE